MAKARVPKTRASGTMTEAAYRGFIRSMLRKGSMRWRPKYEAKKAARHPVKLPGKTARPVFHSRCANCQKLYPETETAVDHIKPVVDPAIGFTSWDDFINRLYCEEENLQVLCTQCHHEKTQAEKAIDTERKRNERRESGQ